MKKIRIFFVECYFKFSTTSFAIILLSLRDHIHYSLLNDEEKKKWEIQEELDIMRYTSALKLFDLCDAISAGNTKDTQIYSTQIYWNEMINKIAPDIAKILEMKNSDEKISKLTSIAHQLID